MNRINRGVQVIVAIVLTAGLLRAQQPLPIVRVLLAKNGMAYVVRSGQIAAPISLTFHPEDMNDILKSFTAWNPDSGNLYSVGYTTGIPSSHMLGRFPFNLTGDDVGLGSFLTQVKGATVRLDIGSKPLEGKLLAAQKTDRVLQQQTSTSDYRLTLLLADGSIQTVWLGEVRSVEFPDPALRDQLKQYLDVLSEGRQDVTRQVSIYPSQGAGPLRVAYLQQFPLWKTSYRMDLGAKDSQIQGWAQVDNPTGEAWENVEVSLLSGSPVSFVMNLYQPLFTNRASVAVPGGQVAGPRQYESAVSGGAAKTAGRAGNDPLALVATIPGYRANAMGHEFDTVSGLPMYMMNGARDGLSLTDGFSATGVRGDQPLRPQPGNTITAAQTTEMQDFFEYRFPFPVQLGGRQSALLPFLQKDTPTERLSIFNATADRGNPRLGVRITNATDVPLEPGPITFFEEGRYAGEAVLDYVPRSEKRLVSFGVDHDIQIAAKSSSRPETTTKITAYKGIVTIYKESLLLTTYEIRNKAATARTLIIEHPRQGDRRLKDTDTCEKTESYYRICVRLSPEAATEITPAEIVSRSTQVRAGSLKREQFVELFSGSETPAGLRSKLGKIIDVQELIAEQAAELADIQAKSTALFNNQGRLRENLRTLRDSREEQSLRTRYLEQWEKEENQINSYYERTEKLQSETAATKALLAELIETLTWN